MSGQYQTRLELIRDRAEAVLSRLDGGEDLSRVLPQAKAVVDDCRDRRAVSYWVEFEIYGLTQVPLQTVPFDDGDKKAGATLFVELHAVDDPDGEVADGSRPRIGRLSHDRKIDPNSIGEIERLVQYAVDNRGDIQATNIAAAQMGDKQALDRVKQWATQNREHQRILRDVRARVYEEISSIRRWAESELENVRLVGEDYRLVLDSLEALRTEFRDWLAAALENVSSPNPAAWSASALLCRNVALDLGRTLWRVDGDSYESEMLKRRLDLKGEREINRLTAFIDAHWRGSAPATRAILQDLAYLARRVYERGSAGKRGGVKRSEAQSLIVDTFRLVAELNRHVGLEPISEHTPSS